MELEIGSNLVKNTSGVLVVEGQEQIALEVQDDGQTLLTMDVYDESGNRVAKLRRNTWVFNDADRFSITTNPMSLTLVDEQTQAAVIEVNVVSRTLVRIAHADFHTSKGHRIVVSPDALRVMGVTMTGNVIDGCGAAFAIGAA